MRRAYGDAFPEDAYADCAAMARLHLADPAPFSWDTEMVNEIFRPVESFDVATGPKRAKLPELPFPVRVGCFYLVNPHEDDKTSPFWIAQIATKGKPAAFMLANLRLRSLLFCRILG